MFQAVAAAAAAAALGCGNPWHSCTALLGTYCHVQQGRKFVILLLLLVVMTAAAAAAAAAGHAEAVHVQCDLLARVCELHSPGCQWGFHGEVVAESFGSLGFCSSREATNTTAPHE
jgi:hypothetical protein